MLHTILKAVHIVFVVSWFAALFYIVRLFIYAAEAQQRPETERSVLTTQLLIMQRRLWNIIGWPAMAGTVITGAWMLWMNAGYYFSQGWMLLKLTTVIVLIGYHITCQRILNSQAANRFSISSFRLRLFNELATILLVAIVFLAVLKSTTGLAYGAGGLLIFGGMLMFAAFLYRKLRKAGKRE